MGRSLPGSGLHGTRLSPSSRKGGGRALNADRFERMTAVGGPFVRFRGSAVALGADEFQLFVCKGLIDCALGLCHRLGFGRSLTG